MHAVFLKTFIHKRVPGTDLKFWEMCLPSQALPSLHELIFAVAPRQFVRIKGSNVASILQRQLLLAPRRTLRTPRNGILVRECSSGGDSKASPRWHDGAVQHHPQVVVLHTNQHTVDWLPGPARLPAPPSTSDPPHQWRAGNVLRQESGKHSHKWKICCQV